MPTGLAQYLYPCPALQPDYILHYAIILSLLICWPVCFLKYIFFVLILILILVIILTLILILIFIPILIGIGIGIGILILILIPILILLILLYMETAEEYNIEFKVG